MHAYFLIRGIQDCLERWKNDLLAQYFPYEHQKGQIGAIQFAVRPVEIIECVFPEPCLQNVLNMVRPILPQNNKHEMFKFYLNSMRKTLKLKKIPDYKVDIRKARVINKAVGVHAIGLKKDRYKDGIEML